MTPIQGFTAVVAAITLVGVAIGRVPALKMNRATIALVGATALIACGVLSLEQAYAAVDWNTILLLFGMMVLNVNLRLAGFFQRITGAVVAHARTPRRLLALIVGVSGVCSAVFLNDTIVLVFTPLVLDMTLALRRNPLPYLVGLVTAANIGSVGTMVGNPQNMLVGLSSGIGFSAFTVALAPIALLGLPIAWAVLVVVYRREFRDEALVGDVATEHPAIAGHLGKSLLAAAVMVVALVAGLPVPLAAALAAALLLVTRRVDPERVFHDIDWGLLVFFSGLFVVTGAIETSGLGEKVFAFLRPYADGGPLPLTLVSLVLSNLVSNVPAVMLFRPVVPTLADPQNAWLTLAMATTLAGNLTLLGSVANLIVAEVARTRGVHLSFVEYLKAGTAIAVLTLGLGVVWLSRAEAPATWAPRALRDVTFERTTERRERGEYLVNGILQCFLCHSERDWAQAGAPPVEGRAGAGAVWWNKPWLIAPNLTPDLETGIGGRTDDMLARAIREGVSHDGRLLHPQMWSSSFSGLIDEDLASVVVYLRSLPPIRNPLPATVIPADVAKSLSPPPSLPPAPPDLSTPVGRGGYLATVADCSGCHTSWHTPRNPGLFGGGNQIERGEQTSYSSNLTSDPSGIGYYDAALFREVMRNGRLRGRTLSPLMPWTAYRRLSDADLDALFAYLAAYRPVRHQIDNVAEPTACVVCGGTHPLGEHNRAPDVRYIDYDIANFRDAPGRYRLYPSFVLTIERREDRLYLVVEGEACELRTPDGRRFECEGGIDEVEFVRGAGGRIVGLLDNRADPAERIE